MNILTLGLESISFQSGNFYKELVAIVEKARELGPTKQNREIIGNDISACTFKHSKIKTTVEFVDGYDNACIYPTFFAPENVLYSKDSKDLFKTYYDELAAIRPGSTMNGLVNTATGSVGGDFSNLIHATYYDTDFIFSNRKFSAEGAAAVILHEIGHGFTFFQFLSDTIMLNVVLQQTYQEMVGASKPGDIKQIVTRSRKRLKLENSSDWSEEVYEKDKELIIKVLAAEAVCERQSRDNKAFYTQDVAEELAEIYCVRQGGAKGLIEVRSYFANRLKLRDINFGILAGSLIAGAAILAAAMLPPIAPALAPFIVTGFAIALTGTIAAATMPEFTKFSQTIGKIRNQMVERLKESNLPKAVIKEALDTIDMAVNAMKEMPDDTAPFVVTFFDFFRKTKRNSVAWREYTDKLESLSTNDLFVRAARLTIQAA